MNTFNLNLDLDKRGGVAQWVTLRQGDRRGTELRATIYDHGTQAGGGYTCRVSIRLPGEGNEYYRETATYTNGVAVVTVDEEYAAAIVGVTEGYFELLQGDAVIASTESFGVRILRSAQDGAVPGDKYDSAIEDALAELDEATGRISQMVVDATEEYLEAHPELTTTVEDNSLTDAKLIQHGGILDRVARLWHRLDNLLTATPAESDALTVTDAAKTPLAGLALYGRSTQDGTPTPSAPVAIQSVENLVISIVNGAYDASTGAEVSSSAYVRTNKALVVAGATYSVIVQKSTVQSGIYIYQWRADGSFVSSRYLMGADTSFAVGEFTADTGVALVALGIGAINYPEREGGVTALISAQPTTAGTPSAGGASITTYSHNAARPSYMLDGTTDSVAWAFNVDGTIATNGTVSAAGASARTFKGFTGGWLPAGTWTASVRLVSGTLSKPHIVRIGTGMNSAWVQASNANDGVAVATFDADGSTLFWITPQLQAATVATNAVFAVQLERGSSATAYVPYAESTTPIDLQGHALRSLPDGTRDEVTVDQYGNATLIQRVFPVTLDGVTYKLNHNSGGYCSGSYSRMRTAPSSGAATWVQCDHFPRVVAAGGCYIANNMFVIRYGDGFNPTSQAELDAWFQANPTTFQFALADAQISYYDLGTIDPIALQGPDMTAQAVPTAPFQLTYERDLNTTLARLEASIAELATN